MKLLADKHLFMIRECLPNSVNLTLFEPDNGLPANTHTYDALIVRTVTSINEQTLPKSGRLSFIGTATAGTDHIDETYLMEKNIVFAHSAGCNSNAVAEYVIHALCCWSLDTGKDLKNQKVGVIGCGHTGSAVIRFLKHLNIPYAAYDPPREEHDHTFLSTDFKEVIKSTIVTFHTPLTQHGKHATYHMCDEEWLNSGDINLLINTARGGVVKETALLSAINSGRVHHTVLDVWENEPLFADQVAMKSRLATPHIAGYSRQAKFKATKIVVSQLCSFFDLSLPAVKLPKRSLSVEETKNNEDICHVLCALHPAAVYSSKLKKLIGKRDEEKKKQFQKLRTEMPLRDEYSEYLKKYPVLTPLFNVQ